MAIKLKLKIRQYLFFLDQPPGIVLTQRKNIKVGQFAYVLNKGNEKYFDRLINWTKKRLICAFFPNFFCFISG